MNQESSQRFKLRRDVFTSRHTGVMKSLSDNTLNNDMF